MGDLQSECLSANDDIFASTSSSKLKTTPKPVQWKDNLDYIVIPQLEGPANELTGLFWMTNYQYNDL
ncbi:unnamed protein product [Rhizophagus irregularis]|nr:unnamed protein product [Rhizophagus irregularis]